MPQSVDGNFHSVTSEHCSKRFKPNIKFSMKFNPVSLGHYQLSQSHLLSFMNNRLSTVLSTCYVSDIWETNVLQFFNPHRTMSQHSFSAWHSRPSRNGIPAIFLTLSLTVLLYLCYVSDHLGKRLLSANTITLITLCFVILKSPFSLVFTWTNIFGKYNTIKLLELDNLFGPFETFYFKIYLESVSAVI